MSKPKAFAAVWAEKRPDAHTADWAHSLAGLGIALRSVGRFGEALQKDEQAEGIYRGLAEKQPDAHTADWARSLANLAEEQLLAKLFSAAVNTAARAVTLVQPLVDKYRLAHIQWVGFAGRVAAEAYLGLGKFEEAVFEARSAAEIWTEVATQRPSFEIGPSGEGVSNFDAVRVGCWTKRACR